MGLILAATIHRQGKSSAYDGKRGLIPAATIHRRGKLQGPAVRIARGLILDAAIHRRGKHQDPACVEAGRTSEGCRHPGCLRPVVTVCRTSRRGRAVHVACRHPEYLRPVVTVCRSFAPLNGDGDAEHEQEQEQGLGSALHGSLTRSREFHLRSVASRKRAGRVQDSRKKPQRPKKP